jgi:hypothetical protein
MRSVLLTAVLLPGLARAQQDPNDANRGKDLEDRGTKVESQKGALDVHAFFETEWHEYDNLDFRPLDESSDQAILDSDDRMGFAFTGVSLELAYQVDPSVRFAVGTSYRGLWGNDQIGLVNRFGGFLYFTSLYVEYTPAKWKYKPTIRVGRQRFDLGGQGGAREFVLGDIVDQVRIDLPLGKIGRLVLVPINVVGLSADNDDVNFISYVGQQDTEIFGFRGDRMTRRHGGLLILEPEKVPGLDIRTYAFYTDVGAGGSGSDISYGGRLGNFADNDWLFNAGVRAAYTVAGLVTPFAAFDASTGIDRKELVTNDVDTTGFAWSAGVVFDKEKDGPKDWGLRAEASYFEAQGPAYLENGQLYSHGYVGMKARQVGGLIANRFIGMHPTSYLGSFGVETSPQDMDRKSGTRTVTAQVDAAIPGPVSVSFGYWFLQDTGVSAVDFATVDTLTPPFGYSREEYAAQERLGRVLGHELDLVVDFRLTKALHLYAYGATMLPGDFQSIVIGRVAGTNLGWPEPRIAWDAGAGVSMGF